MLDGMGRPQGRILEYRFGVVYNYDILLLGLGSTRILTIVFTEEIRNKYKTKKFFKNVRVVWAPKAIP